MANQKNKKYEQRRVTGYLKPNTETLFKGYVTANEISESRAINTIVKEFFNHLPDNQRTYYLNAGIEKQ